MLLVTDLLLICPWRQKGKKVSQLQLELKLLNMLKIEGSWLSPRNEQIFCEEGECYLLLSWEKEENSFKIKPFTKKTKPVSATDRNG